MTLPTSAGSTLPLPEIDPITEQARRRDLRRMKTVALSFLLVAAVIYLACRWAEGQGDAPTWVGFVRAAAEAGMVGGLADWFAVTALFRHPLGIPIPHTAIIRRKKDQLGTSLSSFVGENFLDPDLVADKVSRANLPQRVGAWLATSSTGEKLAAEIPTLLLGILGTLDDEEVLDLFDDALDRHVRQPEWGPPAGRLLERLLEEGRAEPALDLLAARAHDWALRAGPTIDRIVTQDAPEWAPRFVNTLIGDKIHTELITWTRKVRDTPDHDARRAALRFLRDYARDLQNDPNTIASVESMKDRVLSRHDLREHARRLWELARASLLDSADNPESALRCRAAEAVTRLGARLRDDPELGARVDARIVGAAKHLAANYSPEITAIISETIERWDADEASDKIELMVGKDMQFIRINGTVVGALAGLTIHTVSFLLFH